MINSLLILSILVWPFGQLLQLSPVGSAIHLQLLDIIAVITLLVSTWHHQKVTSDPLFKPLAIFILVATLSLVSAAIRGTEILVALLYLTRFVSYVSFYFVFRIKGLKKYRQYLLVSATIFLTIGLLQYIFMPDLRFLSNLGFDDHYYRLIGTLLDPNFSGLILAVISLLFLNLKNSRSFFIIALIALVLTFSRASYLSFIAGLVYLMFRRKQLWLLLAIVVLMIVLIGLAPKPFGEGVNLLRTFSISSRLTNQQFALSLFLKNPLFGLGFNTLKVGVDNSFLFVLATTGVFGLLAFIYFLVKSWQINAVPAVHAGIIAILVHSLFNNSFFFSWILVLFFLLLSFRPKASVST